MGDEVVHVATVVLLGLDVLVEEKVVVVEKPCDTDWVLLHDGFPQSCHHDIPQGFTGPVFTHPL